MDNLKYLVENTSLTQKQISKHLNVSLNKVIRCMKSLYSKEFLAERKAKNYRDSKLGDKNPMLNKTLENHPRYIGEVSNGKGYLQTVKPIWYTGRVGSHHVFVHHVVICEALGLTEIPSGFCVHHIDGDKTNNSLNNLSLQTMGAHQRIHRRMQNNPVDADKLFESRYG